MGLHQGQLCGFSGLEPTWFPSWMLPGKAPHVRDLVGHSKMLPAALSCSGSWC